MVYGTNFLTGRLCSLFLKLPSEKYTSNWPKNMGYAIKNKLSSQEIWQERIRGNDKDKLACPHSNETGMCPLEPFFFSKLKHQLLKWKQAIINDNYKWFSRNLWMAYEQRQSSTVRTTPFNFIPSSVLKHLLKGIFTLQLKLERLEYDLVIKILKKFQFFICSALSCSIILTVPSLASPWWRGKRLGHVIQTCIGNHLDANKLLWQQLTHIQNWDIVYAKQVSLSGFFRPLASFEILLIPLSMQNSTALHNVLIKW